MAAASSTGQRRATPEGPLLRLRRHDNTAAAYGAIRFAGSKRMPSKWAAVSVNSDVDDIVDLLSNTWDLGKPPVLISVTGSAAGTIDLKPKEKAIFERGLRNAAMKTGAWIITGGTNTGVMKLVGQMIQKCGDEAPVCLGIAPMGVIQKHEEMLRSGRGQIFHYPKELCSRKDRASLDFNHTHFVLVDDGTTGHFGGEISCRSAVEDCICRNIDNDIKMDELLPTPMVLLVVSGGPGTLDTIIATLEKARPVIVLADSGGIATRIYRYVKHGELPSLSTKLKNGEPENKREVEALKAKLPVVKKLGEELKGANQVKQLTFFHTSGGSDDGEVADLETEILEAILSDCESTEDAIMHAVKWSQPVIIDSQLQVSRQIDAEGLVRAFQSALIATENKSAKNVVQTLMEYKATARLVRLNRLFDTKRTPACPDPYEVIKTWKHQKPRKRRRLKGVLPIGGGGGRELSRGFSDDEVDGFQLLSFELDEMGYRKNLEFRKIMADQAAKMGRIAVPKRTRLDNYVPPNFTDLMMWAVVVGQPDLAKLLWEKVRTPMRAALMAARVTCKIKMRLGSDHLDAAKIEEASAMYESWAAGVLDEVKDTREATALLTLVPRKRNPKDGEKILLWNDSVMDQACNDDHPCKNFVARSNCQELLGNYFHGNFAGSKAKISRETWTSTIFVQQVINLLVLASFGLLSPVAPNLVKAKPVFEDPANEEEDDDDDEDDDDHWDDSYFGRQKEGDGGKASAVMSWLRDLAVRRWYFWYVPRVKFYSHSIFYVLYILLYAVIICGPGLGLFSATWPWQRQFGYMEANLPQWPLTPNVLFEAMLWIYWLGRIVEEVEQYFLVGKLSVYFGDFWNNLDFLNIFLMAIAAALRIVLWIDLMPPTNIPLEQLTFNYRMLDAANSNLAIADDTRMAIMQTVQICFSLSALVVCVRFVDTLSIQPHFGMLVTIISSMFRDSLYIYIFLAWIACAFSIALVGLLPQGQLSTDYFMRPFWFTFRAVLGDFDLQSIYELLGDAQTPNQNIMGIFAVIVLWFYVLFTTITIINLMIAQMTQAYERIEERAGVVRRYQKVELIREYKDKRSPVPPPFIIFHTGVKILLLVITGRLFREDDDNEETETGFADYMWYGRTEELLKREREYQAKFIKKSNELTDEVERVSRIAEETEQLREDFERANESLVGRFDRVEDRLAKIAAYMSRPADKEKAADEAVSSRPVHVPPAKLQPINHVADATAGAGKGGEGLPPMSAKGRHDPVQAGPAPPYAAAGRGGKPQGTVSYYGGGAGVPGSALSAVRESQAYLTSLSGLPIGGHRNPPRLAQPRTEAAAQADLQLVDAARRVFQAYDRDGSGDIDARELQPALRDLGLGAIDSAQTQAILSRYDANSNATLDFVEFTQLLHELREFQTAANRAEREAQSRPPASVRVAGGGVGSFGYYSPQQIANLQREAAKAERDRLDESARLRSLDAGPPPS